MKSIIKLSKAEIIEKIKSGDNCNGYYVLAVAPDGTDSRIHWDEDGRDCYCPDDWLHIKIPALFPDGEGAESEMAEDMLKDNGRLDEAKQVQEAEDIGLPEIAERFDAERWQAYQDEGSDWLAEAFLAACNGYGDELNDPAPWGFSEEYGDYEMNEAPAEFEWA